MNRIRQQLIEAVSLTCQFQAAIEKREMALVENSIRSHTMTSFLLGEAFDLSDDEVSARAEDAVSKIEQIIDDMIKVLEKGGDSFAPIIAQVQEWKGKVPKRGAFRKILIRGVR